MLNIKRSHFTLLIVIIFTLMVNNVNAQDQSGKKLFTLISDRLLKAYGNIPQIQEMIDSGEDVNYAEKGQSILWVTVSKGNQSNTAEMTKGRYDWATTVTKLLVEKGANVNYQDEKDKRTPLFIAIWNGNFDCAIYLIENGADVNIVDKAGYSPLSLAAMTDTTGVLVDALIQKGADLNIVGPDDFCKMRPLHFAVRFNDKLIVLAKLISAGADINATDMYNATPLYYASYFNRFEAFQYLYENGADPEIKFKNPKTTGLFNVSVSHWPMSEKDSIQPTRMEGFTAEVVAKYRSGQIVKYLSPTNKKQIAILKSFKAMTKYSTTDIGEVDTTGAPSGKTLLYLVQKYFETNGGAKYADVRVSEVAVIKAGASSDKGWPIRLKATTTILEKSYDTTYGGMYTPVVKVWNPLDLLFTKDAFDEWTVSAM